MAERLKLLDRDTILRLMGLWNQAGAAAFAAGDDDLLAQVVARLDTATHELARRERGA
jgi:hypothetical protein